MKNILDFSIVESKSLDDSTVGFTHLGLSTVESESLDFSIKKCDRKYIILIPQTIRILYQKKKILGFSMVESESNDFGTVGFIYLRLSTVEPKSLDFSMQNIKVLNLALIPQKISILYQKKKRLNFSMSESKSLDFGTVGFIYLSLSTVEPKSLDFSMQNTKVLNLASIPQTISILGGMEKILEFSMVESKSLDFGTFGVTYLSLSTVEFNHSILVCKTWKYWI